MVNTLLRQYASHGDEQAFSELVSRFIDLVYATALRQVGGNPHLAQDITQTVFTDLARKAKTLPDDIPLGGWLYRRTCFTAKTALRSEFRRKQREQQALAMETLNRDEDGLGHRLAPLLDEAMNRLSQTDRDALVLRYFEKQSLRDLGTALGTSEDAARMRVERALAKLRHLLGKQGAQATATGLAAVLAAQATTAAPLGLAAEITGAAVAGASAGAAGLFVTTLKLILMTKIKIGITSLIVAAGVATPFAVRYAHLSRLDSALEASLPREFVFSTLQASGNETIASTVESALYAVFHEDPDAYYDVVASPFTASGAPSFPAVKSPFQDEVFRRSLADVHRMWGGDAPQGIRRLQVRSIRYPVPGDFYSVRFVFDYGTSNRPPGAPTHGDITLQRSPAGWKQANFGCAIDPTMR